MTAEEKVVYRRTTSAKLDQWQAAQQAVQRAVVELDTAYQRLVR